MITTNKKSHSAQTIRLIAILGELKNQYPARVSAADIRQALVYMHTQIGDREFIGLGIRNVQRILKSFEVSGMIEGDKEATQGWRLTAAGCEFLGLGERK